MSQPLPPRSARSLAASSSPSRDDQSRDRERGEYRGDDADAERDCETAHRTGTDIEQHAAAMKVVMFESRMVDSARLKPASIAEIALRPPRISSRIRS